MGVLEGSVSDGRERREVTTLGAGTPALIQGKYTFPGSSGSPWEAESPEGDFSREKLEEGRVDKGGCGAAKGGPALLSGEQNQVRCQRGVLRDPQNDA